MSWSSETEINNFEELTVRNIPKFITNSARSLHTSEPYQDQMDIFTPSPEECHWYGVQRDKTCRATKGWESSCHDGTLAPLTKRCTRFSAAPVTWER